MYSSEDYKTLLLRNEISITLDDLISLIKSSSLSYEIRQFSNEVMETEPGFVFKYKQAKALKQKTEEVYRHYRSRVCSDIELMDYLDEAKSILKGKEITSEGSIMSLFNNLKNLINGKEIRRQQAIEELKQTYESVCDQIVQCEDRMKRAIQNGTGHSKDSMIYRDSAREYSRCKNKLVLLRQQQDQLSAKLQKLNDIENVRAFNQMQEVISKASQNAIGNETENERILAKAGVYMEQARQDAQYDNMYGQALYEQAESNAVPQADSEYDAAVARNEMRVSLMNTAGTEAVDSQTEDEFASLTGNGKTENENRE